MLVGSHARRLRCYQARLAELAGDIGGSHGDSAALEGRLTALEERVADLNTTVVSFELSLNALRESMASREWVEGLVKSQGMTRGGAANSSRPRVVVLCLTYSAARTSTPFPMTVAPALEQADAATKQAAAASETATAAAGAAQQGIDAAGVAQGAADNAEATAQEALELARKATGVVSDVAAINDSINLIEVCSNKLHLTFSHTQPAHTVVMAAPG